MALPVTDQLITQMMTENVRTIPTTEMEGNVTRPLIISDLMKAQKDINFSQLMTEYGNIAGLPSKDATPLTKGLMKESPKVPETPSKRRDRSSKTNDTGYGNEYFSTIRNSRITEEKRGYRIDVKCYATNCLVVHQNNKNQTCNDEQLHK